jgi:hypothetical protein
MVPAITARDEMIAPAPGTARTGPPDPATAVKIGVARPGGTSAGGMTGVPGHRSGVAGRGARPRASPPDPVVARRVARTGPADATRRGGTTGGATSVRRARQAWRARPGRNGQRDARKATGAGAVHRAVMARAARGTGLDPRTAGTTGAERTGDRTAARPALGAPMTGAPMTGAPMTGAPMTGAPMTGAAVMGAAAIVVPPTAVRTGTGAVAKDAATTGVARIVPGRRTGQGRATGIGVPRAVAGRRVVRAPGATARPAGTRKAGAEELPTVGRLGGRVVRSAADPIGPAVPGAAGPARRRAAGAQRPAATETTHRGAPAGGGHRTSGTATVVPPASAAAVTGGPRADRTAAVPVTATRGATVAVAATATCVGTVPIAWATDGRTPKRARDRIVERTAVPTRAAPIERTVNGPGGAAAVRVPAGVPEVGPTAPVPMRGAAAAPTTVAVIGAARIGPPLVTGGRPTVTGAGTAPIAARPRA